MVTISLQHGLDKPAQLRIHFTLPRNVWFILQPNPFVVVALELLCVWLCLLSLQYWLNSPDKNSKPLQVLRCFSFFPTISQFFPFLEPFKGFWLGFQYVYPHLSWVVIDYWYKISFSAPSRYLCRALWIRRYIALVVCLLVSNFTLLALPRMQSSHISNFDMWSPPRSFIIYW